MSVKGKINDEVTGIYVGTLLEDMIDTVTRTHKLFCDVLVDGMYDENSEHPLTYVPLWCMSLPLRKGDKVLVKFSQDRKTYPVLYKNPSEIDSQFYEKFTFGNKVTGGNVTYPNTEDTVGSYKIGEDSYVIKTENYTIIHEHSSFILLKGDDSENNCEMFIKSGNINVISLGDCQIDCGGKVNLKAIGKVNIDGNSDIYVNGGGQVKVDGTSGVTINNHLKVIK